MVPNENALDRQRPSGPESAVHMESFTKEVHRYSHIGYTKQGVKNI